MKSTQRHELASNELAGTLSAWGGRIKPYASWLLIGAIIVALAGYLVWNKFKDDRLMAANAQTSLYNAERAGAELAAQPNVAGSEIIGQKVRKLDDFVKEFPKSPLVPLGKLNLANRRYDQALLEWAEGKDVNTIEGHLAEAEALYKELAVREDSIGRDARFGLACVMVERGSAAQKAEAENRLIELAQANPGSEMEKLANDRLKTLRNVKPPVFASSPMEIPMDIPMARPPEFPVPATTAASAASAATATPAASAASAASAAAPATPAHAASSAKPADAAGSDSKVEKTK